MTHLDSHPKHTFAELGVRDEIVRALADRGIEHAFAIQELTLPLAMAGDDLIGQARTGMGKTFAFGAPSSTSGHLMPRYFLGQEGLNPDKDFRNVAFSGAHDATDAFVQAGKVDAGVLNTSVWDKLVEAKKVDTDKVRAVVDGAAAVGAEVFLLDDGWFGDRHQIGRAHV